MRHTIGDLGGDRTPAVKGGKTICYREEDDGTIYYTVAKCSNRDNFCRRTGRLISRGRFEKNPHEHVITKEQRMKWEQDGINVNPVDCLYLVEGL
jgi:hypothetical protein